MGMQQATQSLAGQRPRGGLFQREGAVGYLFVAPALILILIIAFYPIVQSIWYSLTNYLPTYPQFGSAFVGFQNYGKAFQDATFTSSISWTALFTVISVAIEFVLGLLFAIVMNQKFYGRGLVRAAVLVPWAFPTVISAVVWRALLWQNNTGAIPGLLHAIGLVPSDWAPLASSNSLLAAMIFTDVWKTAPFVALLLLAGLQVIPGEVYEAARVDGANVMQRFWRVTLPLLRPTIVVALLFRTLDAWRAFDIFFVIAQSHIQSMSLYAFNAIVVSALNFPVGAAAAVCIFVACIIISAVFIRGFGAQVLA